MATSDVLAALKKLFPNISFNVRTRVNEDIKHMFDFADEDYPHMESEEELYFLLRGLEKDLRAANKKLKHLKHLHKIGEKTIEEVQDQQYYIFELEMQIEDIMGKLGYD